MEILLDKEKASLTKLCDAINKLDHINEKYEWFILGAATMVSLNVNRKEEQAS